MRIILKGDGMTYLTIIVPLYRGKKYVRGMIEQVEAAMLKTDINVELLLINDFPEEYIENISSSYLSVRIINSDINRGIHGARVYGLSLAKGDYVVFLDQDDKIYPNYIKTQLENIGNATAVVCRGISEGMPLYSKDRVFEEVISYDYLLTKGNPIASPGQVMLVKKFIPKVWTDNIMKLNCSDDFFLWACMMARGDVFALNDYIGFEHIVDGNNASLDYELMMKSDDEMLNIIKNANIMSNDDYLNFYTMIKNRYRKKLEGLRHFRTISMNLSRLITNRGKGNSLGSYLKKKGFSRIAIYGAGMYGKTIHSEILCDCANVVAFIDRNAEYIQSDIPIYTMDDAVNMGFDLIIVALTQDTTVLKKQLISKYNIEVYSIAELIFELESTVINST